MMKPRIYIIMLFSILLLTSCQSCPSTIWNDTSCKAPCWHNITPGKNTGAELIQKLSVSDDIDKTSIKLLEDSKKGINEIIWNFKACGNGSAWVKDNIVQEIIIQDVPSQLASMFQPKLKITLGEAIQKFGEPEFVITHEQVADSWWLNLAFYNHEKGVSFWYATLDVPESKKAEVSPDIQIGGFAFYSVDWFENSLQKSTNYNLPPEIRSCILKPWKGYGKIEELYPLCDQPQNQ